MHNERMKFIFMISNCNSFNLLKNYRVLVIIAKPILNQ